MDNNREKTRRIVIKVGTNVLTNKDNRIVHPVLVSLVKQIAALYERGIMSILVTSGSVIAGKEIMGKSHIEDHTIRRQVYSAIGQPRLMRHYYSIFQEFGLICAQVLPTKRDFNPGVHRKNIINCYEGLLSEGVTPIANEDDTVSVTKAMFSDNDELAGLIAELVEAEKLIILTDIDGLYSGHPEDDNTEVIERVELGEDLDQYVAETDKGEAEGRGGMASKLNIAQQAASMNIPTYIANGKKDDIIIDIVDGKNVGTEFAV